MLQLWSGTLSPFSAKVRMALAEKDLPVEILEVPWTRQSLWSPKPEEFLAVSPRGEVPVLIDGDLAVFDSTVILEYLEDAYPNVPLMPADPRARAEVRMWEDAADHAMAKHVTTLIREVFMGGGNQDEIADATAAYQAYHQRLEDQLSEHEFVAGNFSTADLATFLAIGFGSALEVPIAEGHTHLARWFDTVHQRPSVGSEYDAMMVAAATV